MKNFKKVSLITSIIIFAILSYIKLYTIQVKFNNDPTVAIIKTENIQLLNNHNIIIKESIPYDWYKEYGELLYADEVGHKWQRIYSSLIILWGVMLFYIISLIAMNLIKKRKKVIKN
ncbi:hypothetical protein [Clostridium sp.]|uniref:hypothetical protein n=1 Tax=Clostridium sp. TaxID=1506 RepID=UPI002908140F|nr:hypothetical protein [Clostridium sp.]MDU7240567.1 hypothetical protein [Clostridium sp.]